MAIKYKAVQRPNPLKKEANKFYPTEQFLMARLN